LTKFEGKKTCSIFLLFIGSVGSGFVWLIDDCFWKSLCARCVAVSLLLDVAPVSLGHEILPMQWNIGSFSREKEEAVFMPKGTDRKEVCLKGV